MATIKSYTDIEQSRKLAKILPIETADMFHFIHGNNNSETTGFGYEKDAAEFYSKTEFKYIPCWSLTSLLDVLPEPYQMTSNKEGKVQLMLIHHLEKNYYDNPVDACYEMILKLSELKML